MCVIKDTSALIDCFFLGGIGLLIVEGFKVWGQFFCMLKKTAFSCFGGLYVCFIEDTSALVDCFLFWFGLFFLWVLKFGAIFFAC